MALKFPGKGSKSVAKVTGKSPTNVVAGGPGKSFNQKPFAGPAGKGVASSMKKALKK